MEAFIDYVQFQKDSSSRLLSTRWHQPMRPRTNYHPITFVILISYTPVVSNVVILITAHVIYLLSFVETPRKFMCFHVNFCVSTKLNKYIVFTMQTYKKLSTCYVINRLCMWVGSRKKTHARLSTER